MLKIDKIAVNSLKGKQSCKNDRLLKDDEIFDNDSHAIESVFLCYNCNKEYAVYFNECPRCKRLR